VETSSSTVFVQQLLHLSMYRWNAIQYNLPSDNPCENTCASRWNIPWYY